MKVLFPGPERTGGGFMQSYEKHAPESLELRSAWIITRGDNAWKDEPGCEAQSTSDLGLTVQIISELRECEKVTMTLTEHESQHPQPLHP